jgi:hypothetical protein
MSLDFAVQSLNFFPKKIKVQERYFHQVRVELQKYCFYTYSLESRSHSGSCSKVILDSLCIIFFKRRQKFYLIH